jgi:hypothetical protein
MESLTTEADVEPLAALEAPSGDRATRRRRTRAPDLAIQHDSTIDFVATAALADEGFGFAPGTFRADRLRWLYDEAFSDGTSVLGAYAGERKVGHIALVHHSILVDGRVEKAVALMDLFILREFRSKNSIAALYGAVEALCQTRRIRFIVAMPNDKAAPVNRRHLKLTDVTPLDIRVGLAWPWRNTPRVVSHHVADIDRDQGEALLAAYCDDRISGLKWTGARLWARLQKPDAGYACHAGERVLAISAPRSDRRTSYTLICALLPRSGMRVRGRDVAAVIKAACRTHRKPLFVYTGLNDAVPLPGFALPKRLRPSNMILQLRDFAPDTEPFAFQRFEPLDFDFA